MTAPDGPVVEAATIGPGHDGRAELVVSLRHANGATSAISLDEEALATLLASGAIDSLDDLTGRRWTDLSTGTPPSARTTSLPTPTP